MAIEPANAQIAARPVRRLTWLEVILRLDAELQGKEQHLFFGIPRGGTMVAGLAAARGHRITDDPEKATAFLDDIVDSGATKTNWSGQYDRPFFALYERGNEWLQFPWEQDMATEAEDLVRRQLQVIGEDPRREGLADTPSRVVRMWRELFAGYAQDPAEILKRDFDRDGYDQMIVCRDIEFNSMCEHHMLPFYGTATVAYIPDKKIVGLSKLARLVDAYARRLQIQERMTQQIATALETHLQPRGSAVVIEAKHYCMICRGVQKQQSSMVTSALKGFFFDDPKARAEFYQLVHSR
jgi:GTP cyclohydrolase IA